MDFITGLPLSHGYLAILVVVDCLSKFAYFIPLAIDFTAKMITNLLIQHVIRIQVFPTQLCLIETSYLLADFDNICLLDRGLSW